MKKTYLFLLGAILLALPACYISKSLDREVPVRIEAVFPLSIINNGNSQFSKTENEALYKEKFIEGMKAEFVNSQVVINETNPEFTINVSEVTLTESTSIETVNDTTSDDHGKEFELTKLAYMAKGTVVRNSDKVSYDWYATKDKEEKVTSLRSAGQIVTGSNKEKNEYREKELDEGDVEDLMWKCGRRSGNSVVKEIIRSIK
ncbi:MAG: hypothetical protein MI810_11085 [Flavobacteriales bacterium]|nr:hypothetical protein [Flavobacteriales bacterium]